MTVRTAAALAAFLAQARHAALSEGLERVEAAQRLALMYAAKATWPTTYNRLEETP
ncbi:MAG TPA: hypothetical protein VN886_21520 [Acidimicrobiales bacterium]|nr:hypothetical protein [Acidimicrobiales bacterium]